MKGLDRLRLQLVEALEAHLRTGKPVAVPEAGRLLWAAFVELDGTRAYGSTGPRPIPYVEIEAWSRLTRTPLEPHHVAALRAMDGAFLAYAAEEARKAAERR